LHQEQEVSDWEPGLPTHCLSSRYARFSLIISSYELIVTHISLCCGLFVCLDFIIKILP
jgi:hypothetical protein